MPFLVIGPTLLVSGSSFKKTDEKKGEMRAISHHWEPSGGRSSPAISRMLEIKNNEKNGSCHLVLPPPLYPDSCIINTLHISKNKAQRG